jgi:glyceraldehyde 3-phosphate dehydrogenase
MKRIAINGLGRIGRKLIRLISQRNDIEIVAVNDLMHIEMACHLLQFDSTYGKHKESISHSNSNICIAGNTIAYSSVAQIEALPWNDLSIDIFINCSGTYKTSLDLDKYLVFNPRKVILSSPPDSDSIPIIVNGFNDLSSLNHRIISNASCTTYSIVPILDIIERNFGVAFLNFATIHSYTSDQNIQDALHSDYRRARAAANNIIPTTTSATNVLRKLFPKLIHNISGTSYRVPVINGSITELNFVLKQNTTIEKVREILKREKNDKYAQIINFEYNPIVSSDILNCEYASLIDFNEMELLNEKYLKIRTFYDNESGYSNMLIQRILLS